MHNEVYECKRHYFHDRVTSGAGTVNPSGAPEFFPGYLWVRVANSLVLDVVFCRSLFVLSAGHCFVSPSI
jgi:hypothetical protein